MAADLEVVDPRDSSTRGRRRCGRVWRRSHQGGVAWRIHCPCSATSPACPVTASTCSSIGGGAHGLAAAYDAAQRGLSVALVERDDFGSAASFNHLKTIHGGLRYIQTADLKRMRESILERRTLARVIPHLLTPLPFLMPTYRKITRSRLAMRVAFAVDAVVGHDRNDGVPPRLHLPTGRLLSRDECLRRFPGRAGSGAHGGCALVRLPGPQHRAPDAGLRPRRARARRLPRQSPRGRRTSERRRAGRRRARARLPDGPGVRRPRPGRRSTPPGRVPAG